MYNSEDIRLITFRNNTINQVKLEGLALAREYKYRYGVQALAEAEKNYARHYDLNKNSQQCCIALNALTRLKLGRL